MVLEPEIFNYLNDDPDLVFEKKPLESMAIDGQLPLISITAFGSVWIH